jgi:hypothetical protein
VLLPRPLRLFARLLILPLAALAVPGSAMGRPGASSSADLPVAVRANLAQAATDSSLSPWQRDLMVHLARTGQTAGLDSAVVGDGPGVANLTSNPTIDGTWTDLDSIPPARFSCSMIRDPLRNRLVVFGGRVGAWSYFNDVRALSLGDSPAWADWTPRGESPSARAYHSAIYDPVRDRMVVFGGYDGSTGLNDVWTLSLLGTPAWTRLAPTGTAPCGRWTHAAIYDPAHS